MGESGGTKYEQSGTKYDAEKPDFSLIDAEWLEEVAKVMTFGKRKYAAHNWRGGIAVSRLLSAGLRHLWAVVRGEDNDPETGLSHLGHLSCCAMFAFWHLKHRRDLDDRYKQPSTDQDALVARDSTGSRVGLGQPMVADQFRLSKDHCNVCSPVGFPSAKDRLDAIAYGRDGKAKL